MTMKEYMALDWENMSIHGKLSAVSKGIDGLYIPEQIMELITDAANEIADLKRGERILFEKNMELKNEIKAMKSERQDLELKLEIANRTNENSKEIIGMLYKQTIEQLMEPIVPF